LLVFQKSKIHQNVRL